MQGIRIEMVLCQDSNHTSIIDPKHVPSTNLLTNFGRLRVQFVCNMVDMYDLYAEIYIFHQT